MQKCLAMLALHVHISSQPCMTPLTLLLVLTLLATL
jgi:hypothetical protein